MKIICEKCGHPQEVNPAAILGKKGGEKSKRTINDEQQAVMQAAREKKKNIGQTARDKFVKGRRVIMTTKGQDHLWEVLPRTGVVATLPRNKQTVCILVDGRKTTQMYHIDFWEMIN